MDKKNKALISAVALLQKQIEFLNEVDGAKMKMVTADNARELLELIDDLLIDISVENRLKIHNEQQD
jgi:hypothetical protein